jgi:hypothetical protein
MNDETKLYHELDWAARRWDWFNKGRIVEPRSFCQFWRTALLYATLKQLFGPLTRPLSAIGSFLDVPMPIPKPVRRFMPVVAKAGWFMLRTGGRIAWLLTYPLRSIVRQTASPVLTRAVRTGKRIDTFEKRHRKGVRIALVCFLAFYVAALASYFAVLLFLATGLWMFVGLGALVLGSFALYGFFKSGAPGVILDGLVLLSDAALAAKHGVCPPVRIIRAP